MAPTNPTNEEIWEDLWTECEGVTQRGTIKRLVATNPHGSFFIGVQTPSKLLCFMAQLPATELGRFHNIKHSRGFSLQTLVVGDEFQADFGTLILYASSVEYNEIFRATVSDILTSVGGVSDPYTRSSALFKRMSLWQVFFEKHGMTGLSHSSQLGLFGELHFLLKYLLDSKLNCQRTLKSWTGPNNRQHDFQLGDYCIEVKTSSKLQDRSVEISSEIQLDDDIVENLFLFWISVDIVEYGNNTLPNLVRRIREFLYQNDESTEAFESSLLASGYTDAESGYYESRSYSIRSESAYRIECDFPRIRPSDLRAGVRRVRYQIDESFCSPYKVRTDDFRMIILESFH